MAIRLLNNYNTILYHLGRITRDRLNWTTETSGNIALVITRANGGAKNSGTRLIRRLHGYNCVISIRTIASGGNRIDPLTINWTTASNGVGSDSTVEFNPNSTPSIGTLDENTGISRPQDRPSWIGFAHELIHADHIARGTLLRGTSNYSYKDTNGNMQTASTNRFELAAVGIGGFNNSMDITENDIRRDQGLRVRSAY